MNEAKEYIWYTGDWKQQNNVVIPYNGVQIKATPNYSRVTSPPTSQKLISVEIEVVDYTNSPVGISSVLSLYKTDIWYAIPIPENIEVSSPEPNSKFTVVGLNNLGLGQLQLNATITGTYLEVQFRYGVFNREELGFIMRIKEIYPEEQDPIIVSG